MVGVGVFADEVLPDELYPRRRIVLSHDVVAPFDCRMVHPPADDALTLEQLEPIFFPDGCSRDPSFMSLTVAGGHRGVPGVLGAIAERLDEENSRLPKAMRDRDFGFSVIPTVTGEELARVQDSLAPSVRALQLLGLVAAVSTLAVAGLGAVRASRRMEEEARVWFELGLTRPQRVAVVAVPLAVAGVIGLAAAAAVGWVGSGIGPVASASALEPQPSRALPLAVAGAVTAVASILLAAEFAAASVLATRKVPAPASPQPSRLTELALRAGHVPLALGVGAAVPKSNGARGGAGTLLGGAVIAVVALVGCIAFSSNLSGLVGTASRFGWPFDVAFMVNYGYGGVLEPRVAEALDRDEVHHWGLGALPGEVTLEGETVPALAAGRGFDRFPVPVVDGRLPATADEIGLGVRSAKALGVGIGDRTTVATSYGNRDATVTGLVVLPSIGPFLSDRVGLGTGVLLSAPFLEAVVGGAERDRGLPPGELGATLGTFVAVDLRDGVDAERFARELGPQVITWDANAFPGLAYSAPVRPPEIADAAAMRSVPTLLAVLLSVAMSAALALGVALGTRGRRRELAVLRALGCTARQLRATVRWHALAVVAFGMAAGVLPGMSLGAITWRTFSEDLGAAPAVSWPVGWIALVIAAGTGVALAAGALPARSASRRASAVLLRQP